MEIEPHLGGDVDQMAHSMAVRECETKLEASNDSIFCKSRSLLLWGVQYDITRTWGRSGGGLPPDQDLA